MSILARYIIRQHIGPFFFGFSIITLIFILNLLFRELNRILSKGLPAAVVTEFFFLNLAWIVALAVPMALLTASLMAFGRMSADNEITAFKASGVSLYRLIAPALALAAALCIFLIWFNNAVLPEFNHRLALLMRDISRKKPTVNIEPGVWYDEFADYGLMVSALQDSAGVSLVENVLINDYHHPDFSTAIIARHGRIRVDEKAGLLILNLYDGEMQEINIKKLDEFRRVKFPKHVIRIDITDRFLKRSDSASRSDREKSAGMMRAEVEQMREQQHKTRKQLSQLLALQFNEYFGRTFNLPLPNSPDSLDKLKKLMRYGAYRVSRPAVAGNNHRRRNPDRALQQPDSATVRMLQLRALQQHRSLLAQLKTQTSAIRRAERRCRSLEVEIQKKYSIPVACIIFILIGAPLGVMARSGGMAVGGGVSLGFFLLYWASLIGGEDLADRGIISPFWAMWSANVVVGLAGVYLVFSSVRESKFIEPARLLEVIRDRWPFSRTAAIE